MKTMSRTTAISSMKTQKPPSKKPISSTQLSFYPSSTAKKPSKVVQDSALLKGKSVSNSHFIKRMTDFLEKKLLSKSQKRLGHSRKKLSTEVSESSKVVESKFSKTANSGFSSFKEPEGKRKDKVYFPSRTDLEEKVDNGKFASTLAGSFSPYNAKFSINIDSLRSLREKILNSRAQKKTVCQKLIVALKKPSVSSTNDSSPSNASRYYLDQLAKACTDPNPCYIDHLFSEHLFQALQAAKFAEFIDCESEEILQQIDQKRVLLPPSKFAKSLVFDLDETLIHCNEDAGDVGDSEICVQFPNGELFETTINFRPFVKEVLKHLSEFFEIILFTASHSSYGEEVVKLLDPHNEVFAFKFFRESCISCESGIHMKDLRVLGNRNLKDLMLVDNSNFSFALQPENGIPIIPFYDYKEDNQLLLLSNFVMGMSGEEDVRKKLIRYFALHELEALSTLEEAQKFSIKHYRDICK